MPQKIYVPEFNATTMPCVTVSSTTIRVYQQMPLPNRQDVPYIDYYHQSSYLWTTNTQDFGNTINLSCIPNHLLTSDFMYRNDIDGIMITFAIYSTFLVLIPLLIFKRLFRKR